MKFLNGTKEQFQQLMALQAEGPLKMLNLLKFKSVVDKSGKSGAEHYKDYLKAAEPFFVKANARILFYGRAKLTLIGPKDLEWDNILIVEYATKEDFLNMVTNPDYPSHIRQEALEDARLIYCT
jgi:uncharacterized protein (DUF1330 family)